MLTQNRRHRPNKGHDVARSRIKIGSSCIWEAFLNRKAGFITMLFLLALLARFLFFLFYFHGQIPLAGDTGTYVVLAKALLGGEGFSTGGSPHAFRLPLYPIFLAVHYQVFGTSNRPIVVTQFLISSLVVVLIFLLARWSIGERAAYVASCMAIVHPNLLLWVPFVLTETLSLFLLIAAFYAFVRFSATSEWAVLGLGSLFLGLASLCRPENVVFFLAVLLWLGLAQEKNRNSMSYVLLHSVVFLAVLSPWLIRNYLLRGRLILTTQTNSILTYSTIHWERFRDVGQTGSPHETNEAIVAFIVQCPTRYLGYLWDRFRIFWLMPFRFDYSLWHKILNISIYPILSNFAILFALFRWLQGKTNQKIFSLFFFLLGAKTLLIMFTIVDTWDIGRFHLPIDPLLIILIAYAVDVLVISRLRGC